MDSVFLLGSLQREKGRSSPRSTSPAFQVDIILSPSRNLLDPAILAPVADRLGLETDGAGARHIFQHDSSATGVTASCHELGRSSGGTYVIRLALSNWHRGCASPAQ